MSDSRGAAAPLASRWGPVAAWAGAILVLTSWPSPRVAPSLYSGADKVAHFGVYFVLGVLVWRALRPPRAWRRAALALVAIAAFGAVDELHQFLTPGRSPDPLDWVADTSGGLLGLLLAPHLLALAPRRQDLST